MKKFLNLLAGITIGMSSFAQTDNSGKISGSIKDGGNQKIIDAASVSLLKAKDSSLVKVASRFCLCYNHINLKCPGAKHG